MKRFTRSFLLIGLVVSLMLAMVACSPEKEEATQNPDLEVGGETDGGAEDIEKDDEEQDDEEEEGLDHHHDIPYEWSGVFQLEEGTHTIKFNKNEGDESILLAFISTAGSITDMEHHAAHVMEADAIHVEKNNDFKVENEYTYKLKLNNESAEFNFEVESPGEYYIFIEHLPEEFDMEILNAEGKVLEGANPTEYEGDHDHDHD